MIRRLAADALRRAPVRPLADLAPADAAPADEHPPIATLTECVTRLLADELSRAPGAVAALVDGLLAHFRGASDVVLKANPADLALLEPADALAARHALSGALTLLPDPAMTQGGCLVSAPSGEVDARVETRVARALGERGAS